MTDGLIKRLRDWEHVYAVDDDKPEGSLYIEAADRIEELEAQIKKDAMQYLSDTGEMGDTIADLTRRHQHALHKIDVLEDKIDKALRALEITDQWLRELDMYANPDYHLVPSLQQVRTTLAELKGEK